MSKSAHEPAPWPTARWLHLISNSRSTPPPPLQQQQHRSSLFVDGGNGFYRHLSAPTALFGATKRASASCPQTPTPSATLGDPPRGGLFSTNNTNYIQHITNDSTRVFGLVVLLVVLPALVLAHDPRTFSPAVCAVLSCSPKMMMMMCVCMCACVLWPLGGVLCSIGRAQALV
jgi:hypothetical protein